MKCGEKSVIKFKANEEITRDISQKTFEKSQKPPALQWVLKVRGDLGGCCDNNLSANPPWLCRVDKAN